MKKIKLNAVSKPRKPREHVRSRDVKNLARTKSKESKSKSKRKINFKLIIIIVAIIMVMVPLGLFLLRWKNHVDNSYSADGTLQADACVDFWNPDCLNTAIAPKLEQVDGKTNVLVVGIDTRASGSGSGLRNTDTIILGTLDHKTKDTRMISFPRDLYAPYGCEADSQPYKTKINAIYAYGQSYCDYKDGMRTLRQTIETITGEKIQYTLMIRLEGVIEAVDAIGGIDVNVTEDHTDIYPYIELSDQRQQECVTYSKKTAYCVFSFEEGVTHMDGETALIYGRMRYLSSDFDRGRRQQEVIKGVKDTIMADDKPITQKAQNLFNVYSKLTEKIEVKKVSGGGPSAEDFLAGLFLADEVNTNPLSIVVDPSFGGGGVIVKGSGSNYNFVDYTFSQVQEKLSFIDEYADLYRDKAKIYAVNYTGSGWTDDNGIIKLKNSGLWFIDIITDTKSRSEEEQAKVGVEIVDYTGGEYSSTIKRLKQEFGQNTTIKVITANEDNGLTRSDQFKEDIRVNIYSINDKPAQNTESSEKAGAGTEAQ
jgi:LCP family protein required for cell wall assembly